MYQQIVLQLFGLILASIPLSYGIIRFLARVTHLSNPALANSDVICTDLTGVLTQPTLEIESLHLPPLKIKTHFEKDQLEIENKDNNEILRSGKSFLKNNRSAEICAITANLCHYPKTAEIEKIMTHFFLEAGFGKHKIENDYQIIQKLPTNSEKKISTIVTIKTDNQDIFAFSKGHPDKIIDHCSRIQIGDKKRDISANDKARLRKLFKKLNREGQKAIGFAYKGLPKKRLNNYSEEFTESDLIFVGVIGFGHPLNEDLIEHIALAQEENIRIYITTSKKERKARAIGMKLGIVNPSYFEVLSGIDLNNMPDGRLEKVISDPEKDYIFAELEKTQKKQIVKALQKEGHTITLANTEPGQDLKSIINNILRERTHEKNRNKYFYHQLAGNFMLISVLLTNFFFGLPVILTIPTLLILLVAINLPLELALRASRTNNENLNSKKLTISSLVSITLFLTLNFFTLSRLGFELGIGSSLATSVAAEAASTLIMGFTIFQIINALSFAGQRKNPLLFLSSILSFLIAFGITSFNLEESIFQISKFSKSDLTVIIFLSLILILIQAWQFRSPKKTTSV